MKPIPLTRTKHGFSVRIRCGGGSNPRFTIGLRDEKIAQARAQRMAEFARMLVGAGRADIAQLALTRASEQVTDADFESIAGAVRDLCDEARADEGKPVAPPVTFQALAERWTSGQLARDFPDHVKVKATSDFDHQRLSKLYPSIGAVPLTEFTVAHAKQAMAAIPDGRLPGTRRHYCQLISRVLGLAAWPCEIIERSPLPRGFLPKVGKRPAFDYLRPAEDERLLGCTLVPFEARLLYGVLAREGMRLGEARRLLWRHLDLERGVIRVDLAKGGVGRVWALGDGVARVLRELGRDRSPDLPVFDAIPRKAAELFRDHLEVAGISRAELFERSPQRRPIRVHDLRATFVTLNLAEGRSEAWICDRTGHRSSQMVNAYRRAARMATELGLGPLRPLDECLPELAAGLYPDAQGGEPEGEPRPTAVGAAASERSNDSEQCAREGSNLHALRRWNLKPLSDADKHENTAKDTRADARERLSASSGSPETGQHEPKIDPSEHLRAALAAAAEAGDFGLVRTLADLLEARRAEKGTDATVLEISAHKGKRRPQ